MFIDNLYSISNKLKDEDVSDINIIKSRLNKINNIYLKDLLESKSILEDRGKKSIIRKEAKSWLRLNY